MIELYTVRGREGGLAPPERHRRDSFLTLNLQTKVMWRQKRIAQSRADGAPAGQALLPYLELTERLLLASQCHFSKYR